MMGTNYYFHDRRDCPCCKRPFPELHIGKSSAGWCFALHVIPEDGINDLQDWEGNFLDPESYIENEYGEQVSVEKMLDVIKNRSWDRGVFIWTPKDYADNHAEPGPNGLVRHKIDGHRCVKHGEGTWDCIKGDFS